VAWTYLAGIGGLTLALDPWVQPITYCENDRYAQAVLLSRQSTGQLVAAPIWDDVTTPHRTTSPTSGYHLWRIPLPRHQRCRTWRRLGGTAKRSFYEIVRLAKEIQPAFLYLENVPAIRTRGASAVVKELASSGMTVGGQLFPLKKWERCIDESAGGCLLPTPSASSYGTNRGGAAGRVGQERPSLETMARRGSWPPLKANSPSPTPSNLARAELATPQAAPVPLWPTPRASDGAKGGPGQKFGAGGTTLPAAVRSGPTGGQLSPMWTEWLMGYPSGWTALEDWATQWFRPKRVKRSKG
jgi:hypothetical protein